MSQGEEVRSAIKRGDATTLRRMAEEARQEQTRMLLELLADVIDHQPKKSTQVKNAALGRKARRTEFGADS